MKHTKFTPARLFVAAFLLCFSITLQTQAAPSDLDPSFGNGGIVTSADFYGRAIAIQADGKIVAAGNGLERYNPDGSLDTYFGTGGRVVLPGSDVGCAGSYCHFYPSSATAVAIQADGKIIAAGTGSLDNNGDTYLYATFALWRYNTDGSLDTSFGSGGRVVSLFSGSEGGPRAVAIQSDGKIVAAGYARFGNWDFLTARYNANGTLDASFGLGGKVVTSFGGILDEANDVAIQSDGKIVVAGRNRTGTFQTIPFIINFALARYNTDGSLDTSFGSGGKVVTPFGDSYGAKAIAIQADGKIVAVGESGSDDTNHTFALARYDATGSLDISFGTGGKVLTAIGNRSGTEAVAIQSDGKIVAAGSGSDGTNSGVALARYNTNGSLDSTFGSGGKVVTSSTVGAKDAAIQSDGKIVVLSAGSYYDPAYALFRYQARAESSFTVTRSDDRNNGACISGDCSLREAINAANASATDDTINFTAGLTTVTLANGISINKAAGKLTISGRGANVFTIDGGAGTNRIFNIFSGTITVSGVTLTGGNGNGAGIPDGYGGAIVVYGNSLTLDGVHVTGNTVSAGQFSGGYGGGLNFQGGTNRIINSTVSGNTALACGGFDVEDGTLTIINSTISGNTAMGGNGGGGFCGGDGSVILRNVTVANNTAPNCGGIAGIFSPLDLGNTIVAGNVATAGNLPDFCSSYGGSTVAGSLLGPSINARLGALQNNGGTVPTHALLAGSPAIDNGLNALVSPLAAAFDQRGTGFARIRDGNGDGTATVDIGAFEAQTAAAGRTPFDFDGDGKADQAVFRPSDRNWYLLRSSSGFTAAQFGNSLDKIVPADFDGDGKTDIAVFRDGFWSWLNSSNGSFQSVQFGQTGDVPVPADYTGDGRDELAVYRGGLWYTLNLTNNQLNAAQFGNASDKPVPADFDGDGKTDFAVYRDGTWYLLRSMTGFTAVQFGIASDKPVVGDYDGDSKADPAVYRNGVWYVLGSSQGFSAVQFGIVGDVPAAADYDGDGKTDIAVFRDGTWYLLRSQQGFGAIRFGAADDKPIPAALVP